MESWDEFSAPHDTSTVRVSKKRQAGKKKRNQWWSQDNFPRLKEALVKSWDPYLRGQCGVACLELCLDRVPKQTVFNVLQRFGRKLITYDNVFPDKKRALLSNSQVNYVKNIIIK